MSERTTEEGLRDTFRRLLDAAYCMPDAGLTRDDPRYEWWFTCLVPARDHAALALAAADRVTDKQKDEKARCETCGSDDLDRANERIAELEGEEK